MIGSIEGEIIWSGDRALIVNVGGVGYSLSVSDETAVNTQIGEIHRFWTHLAVKDDALDLYGFRDQNELRFFRLLLGISGIGPKSALNILSLASINTLIQAIEGGDGEYLTKVSGIGKKLGQKIILELKEKVATIPHESTEIHTAETEALDALEALGYNPRDTRDVVHSFAKDGLTTQEVIRKALQTLGKNK